MMDSIIFYQAPSAVVPTLGNKPVHLPATSTTSLVSVAIASDDEEDLVATQWSEWDKALEGIEVVEVLGMTDFNKQEQPLSERHISRNALAGVQGMCA